MTFKLNSEGFLKTIFPVVLFLHCSNLNIRNTKVHLLKDKGS